MNKRLLANNSNKNQQQQITKSIKHGSMITWQHVNLQVEYDFYEHAANDVHFDLTKIFAFWNIYKTLIYGGFSIFYIDIFNKPKWHKGKTI